MVRSLMYGTGAGIFALRRQCGPVDPLMGITCPEIECAGLQRFKPLAVSCPARSSLAAVAFVLVGRPNLNVKEEGVSSKSKDWPQPGRPTQNQD